MGRASERASTRLLQGRHVLVTGAASGIGRAVAAACQAAGASVTALDVADAAGVMHADATSESDVVAAFESASEMLPLTDVVHAAGVFEVHDIRETALDEWQRVIDVNLTGAFLVGREAARRLSAGGTITLIASVAARRGEARRAAYSASKFGVLGLMESMARDLAPAGIRVNAICPGSVDTPMGDDAVAREAALLRVPTSEMRDRFAARIPLGRLADPAEIADVCVFLASPLARYVAGSTIVVNGAA